MLIIKWIWLITYFDAILTNFAADLLEPFRGALAGPQTHVENHCYSPIMSVIHQNFGHHGLKLSHYCRKDDGGVSTLEHL